MNYTYGHHVGDRVLKEIVRKVKKKAQEKRHPW
ncbi:MAG: diguanylate cyclase [Acidobacteria bacterium]|nr:MAG: diguanylate cyclase [Acidobacteriota bacterium]